MAASAVSPWALAGDAGRQSQRRARDEKQYRRWPLTRQPPRPKRSPSKALVPTLHRTCQATWKENLGYRDEQALASTSQRLEDAPAVRHQPRRNIVSTTHVGEQPAVCQQPADRVGARDVQRRDRRPEGLQGRQPRGPGEAVQGKGPRAVPDARRAHARERGAARRARALAQLLSARPADRDSPDGTVDGAVGERRPGRAHSEADRDQERAQSPATAARCCRGHSGGATEPRQSEWVFPAGRSVSGHVTEPKSAWEPHPGARGVADVSIHDLRRTLGSWLAGAGFSLPMIGCALGHQSPSSTSVYARLDLDPVRRMLEANAWPCWRKQRSEEQPNVTIRLRVS